MWCFPRGGVGQGGSKGSCAGNGKAQSGALKSVRVGLVHGQMGREKDEILEAFYRHELDVLVATTVIEVGMNIPRATVMVVKRRPFRLSPAAPASGRVGRGDKQGYCF